VWASADRLYEPSWLQAAGMQGSDRQTQEGADDKDWQPTPIRPASSTRAPSRYGSVRARRKAQSSTTAPTPRGVEGAQQQRQVQMAQVAATRWVCDPDPRELLH
jgi:hypothetical protein